MRRSFLINSLFIGLTLANQVGLRGQSGKELRQEFHQVFPLNEDGAVSLENYSGTVRMLVWDRNEVSVDAVKHALSRERLDEAKINVDADAEDVRIRTRYPETFCTCNNPASVDYTITLPRKARLSAVNLINGSLEINGVAGDVKVSSINGHVTARGLRGSARMNTVNGQLEAVFDRLSESQTISLESVNGPIILTIPPDSSAQFKASSAKGEISNDLGLAIRKGEHSDQELSGNIGKGNTLIRLNNVNGSISIRTTS